MGKETLKEKFKRVIGLMAWKIFLWSINMNEAEYFFNIIQEHGEDY